jgi:hypothetical protein
MDEDLISIAGQIESRFAGRKLYEALASASVIPARPPSALGSLKDALSKSPRNLVEEFPRTEAYQRLLDQLDAQIRYTRSVGSVLLALLVVVVATTIFLAAQASTKGDVLKDLKTWVSALSSVGIGAWNKGNSNESHRLFDDYQRLVKIKK